MSETTRTPYPKYQECPCGSGSKYKFCCYTKSFHYYLEEDNTISKSVPVSKELGVVLSQRKTNLDFDGDQVTALLVDNMRKIGIRPELIYAFEKTGLLVTEDNKRLIPDIDLAEWGAAVEEYYELHPADDPMTS